MTEAERQDKRDGERHDRILARLRLCYARSALKRKRVDEETGVVYYAGNSLIAWRAFEFCRFHKRPVPEWVFQYLDQVAWSLRTADRPVGDAPAVAGKALRLDGRRLFKQADDLLFRLDIAIEVERRRKRLGVNRACQIVANKLSEKNRAVSKDGVSKDTVRRWWAVFCT